MSDMTFTRVGTIKPENAQKVEMFEINLGCTFKERKERKI